MHRCFKARPWHLTTKPTEVKLAPTNLSTPECNRPRTKRNFAAQTNNENWHSAMCVSDASSLTKRQRTTSSESTAERRAAARCSEALLQGLVTRVEQRLTSLVQEHEAHHRRDRASKCKHDEARHHSRVQVKEAVAT